MYRYEESADSLNSDYYLQMRTTSPISYNASAHDVERAISSASIMNPESIDVRRFPVTSAEQGNGASPWMVYVPFLSVQLVPDLFFWEGLQS